MSDHQVQVLDGVHLVPCHSRVEVKYFGLEFIEGIRVVQPGSGRLSELLCLNVKILYHCLFAFCAVIDQVYG